MKSMLKYLGSAVLLASSAFMFFHLTNTTEKTELRHSFAPKMEKTVLDRAENALDRQEHFQRLTQNPVTKEIPANIRSRELNHAMTMKELSKSKLQANGRELEFEEIGPFDIGGRTRALGVDSRNPDIILAGGVSGGIWKSTDGGQSWQLKSELGQNLGLTALMQDSTTLDTWFYSTGEFSGNSARARGGGGSYYGSGIYKSTDNGETWAQIASTEDTDVSFNTQFDFISSLAENPQTGTKFFASNAIGIYRSTDDFVNSDLVLGGFNEHVHSDVKFTPNGTGVAIISSAFSDGSQTNTLGVYVSTNDGVSWMDITPLDWPTSTGRGVIGLAPSNNNVFYAFVAGPVREPNLYRFDISDLNNVVSSNRTDGIPDFGDPVGDMNLQGGYNMICAVHPDDENFVLIGGTNLYRSTDGFSSTPVDADEDGFTDSSETDVYWIGGYGKANNVSQFFNHHPDQHNILFDPTNSNRVISAHDGGLSVTNDITSQNLTWSNIDDGYNVTQFYTVSIHPGAGDDRVLGGTQDNGSPYFEYAPLVGNSQSFDISSGDGSYAYVGNNLVTTSSQRGRLIKYDYTANGDPTAFSYIAPVSASNQLFIHPYIVDPIDENFIYYPSGNVIWRNNSALTIARNTSNPDGTSEGWTRLNFAGAASGSIISTLAVSRKPANVLYYASFRDNTGPQIFRMDNAHTAADNSSVTNISITALNSDSVPPAGAYVHDIAINEDNANEVIVVISNYETESIYHTTDGGTSWTGIGGNLEPANGNGPSVRTALITKTAGGERTYFVGTSTGLYAVNTLDGANTEWIPQATATIGQSVVEFLDYRVSDKVVVAATHGRGIFVGSSALSVSNADEVLPDTPENYSLNQNFPNPFNPATTISYSLPVTSEVTLTVYDINGRKVAELLNNRLQNAGEQNINFNASNLASGTYLYRVQAKSVSGSRVFSQTKRMTLIK